MLLAASTTQRICSRSILSYNCYYTIIPGTEKKGVNNSLQLFANLL